MRLCNRLRAMLLSDATPFVLLDDARPGGSARLFRAPERILRADTPEAVAGVLDAIDDAVAAGKQVAGFLSYEAGRALSAMPVPNDQAVPLAWFGIFNGHEAIGEDEIDELLPAAEGAWAGAPRPTTDGGAYADAFARVRAWIEAGDIYQANLTFRAQVSVLGDPRALYAGLRLGSRAGHGALVWTGEDWLLSLSPELFFEQANGRITARPMKGTALRDPDPARDAAAAERLAADPKQRAENLMIVDLLRNDIAQVTEPGSVAVPRRFHVERYPTVYQMVSDVTGTLANAAGPRALVKALFPCGSVTGAPKRRAMEVIDSVERTPRGIYTGAIGWMGPAVASFNVAIRTLHMKPGAEEASLGLGSGIVADSRPGDEWRECLAKGRFVTQGQRRFDLIETMAFYPDRGVPLLERHLDRMKASAGRFGVPFDRHVARNELQAATFRLEASSRLRMLLSPSGALALEAAELPPTPSEPVAVAIMPLPVHPTDFRLRYKTSDRSFYDAARASAGTFEVLFLDPDGFLTEGSFTSLFVERDGVLATPPATRPLLPGVLRAELLAASRAVEAELTLADIAQGFYLGNALRGLIPARLVADDAPGG